MSEPSRIVSLFVVACCASSATLAQVETGDVQLSFTGSLRWASSGAEGQPDADVWGVNARIAAGFFVSPHVDVGGIVGLGYSDSDTGHSYSFTVGPEANYHFRPHSNVVPLVGAGFGYLSNENEFPAGESRTDNWYGEVHAGADFFLNRNVAIKLLMEYRHSRADQKFTDPLGAQTRTGDADEISAVVGLAFFFK